MGLFKRLIGKVAGSDTVKRLVGKVSHHAKHLVGKLENGYAWLKKNAPGVTSAAENAAENLGVAKSAREAYHHAKDAIDIGDEYGNGNYKAGQDGFIQAYNNSRKRRGLPGA